MLAGLEAAALTLTPRHPTHWVVDCKSVGNGRPVLIYLGRYLYRGVIREGNILALDEDAVRIRFRNANTWRLEHRCRLSADFLWLALQQLLPTDFPRARNVSYP